MTAVTPKKCACVKQKNETVTVKHRQANRKDAYGVRTSPHADSSIMTVLTTARALHPSSK